MFGIRHPSVIVPVVFGCLYPSPRVPCYLYICSNPQASTRQSHSVSKNADAMGVAPHDKSDIEIKV